MFVKGHYTHLSLHSSVSALEGRWRIGCGIDTPHWAVTPATSGQLVDQTDVAPAILHQHRPSMSDWLSVRDEYH